MYIGKVKKHKKVSYCTWVRFYYINLPIIYIYILYILFQTKLVEKLNVLKSNVANRKACPMACNIAMKNGIRVNAFIVLYI